MTSLTKILEQARVASRELAAVSITKINAVLKNVAKEIIRQQKTILASNAKDLQALDPKTAFYERAKLTPKKLAGLAKQLTDVAKFRSPLGQILERRTHPNGLRLEKVSVPLGVIGIIYESRPTVTLEVFSLCLKSGNVGVLKGGSEVARSNSALVKIIHRVLAKHKINPAVITLIPPTRAAVRELLAAHNYIDLLIARGGRGLIDFVRQNARVPVLETGAGVCHVYFDAAGDLKKGLKIITNSKVSRPAVCNSLDILLINKTRLQNLPALMSLLPKHNVVVYADAPSYRALAKKYPGKLLRRAVPSDFSREFLSLQMAVKTVNGLDEALAEITRSNGNHSEAVITENKKIAETFLARVDAAAVYWNAATVFTDGGQFGLGAEIGISTQKLHARGPVGLRELTSYKWIARGNGQTRP